MWEDVKFWLLPVLLMVAVSVIALEGSRIVTQPHPDCMGDPAC